MYKDFADASSADTSGYPPKYNWGPDDSQPMDLPNPTAHLRVTKKLIPDFLSLGVDILIDAGYAKPSDKDSLVESLQNLYNDRRTAIADALCDDAFLPRADKDKLIKKIKLISELPSGENIADALLKGGTIHHAQVREVLKRLKHLPEKPSLFLYSGDNKLGSVSVYWRIKDETSAYTKMRKDGKAPGEIGDYFGMRFVPNTVEGTVRLRAASLEHSMTSRKCEFSVPSSEIYVSHKSHNCVTRESAKQTGEFQILHEAVADREKITHKLKEMEDNMKSWNETKEGQFSDTGRPAIQDPKVQSKVALCAEELRQIRIFINGSAAASTGLLDLALPEDRKRALTDLAYAKRSITDVSTYTEKMLARVEGIQGVLGTVREAAKIANTSASAWNISLQSS